MLTRRLIACLDVDNGVVVKGTQFRSLQRVGLPTALAAQYAAAGADEIVLLDIAATPAARPTMLQVIERTAKALFIPLTVGGGVRTVNDVHALLHSGADKVGINSAAVARPALLTEAADRFGAQCVVASIDAKRVASGESGNGSARWRVTTHGGRQPTSLDAVAWAQECVERGAGELLVTSIDADGTRAGYDLALTRAIAAAVRVPVIASGGAGGPSDVCAVLRDGGADAALVAGILHDGTTTIQRLKLAMREAGLPVRQTDAESVLDISTLNFEKGAGSVVVVAQDAVTGSVLMVANADREAVERTLATGEMHYTSRRRGLWHKGATSGNRQRVVSLLVDCDGDAILARVTPLGPACHTGSRSCFDSSRAADAVAILDRRIAERATAWEHTPGVASESYTARLLSDRNVRLKKLGEELAEFVVACADENAAQAAEEAADLVYHILVALRATGAGFDEVRSILASRAR